MARINDNYLKLQAGYLFPEIGRRIGAFAQANPDVRIIRLGIGDVTEPLPGHLSQTMAHRVADNHRPANHGCRNRDGQGHNHIDASVEERTAKNRRKHDTARDSVDLSSPYFRNFPRSRAPAASRKKKLCHLPE